MARLIATSALQGLGLPLAVGGARLAEVDPGPAISIAPFHGQEAAVARSLGGAALPEPGRMEPVGVGRLVWTAPARWLLLGAPAPAGLGRIAAVVDQGDGMACAQLTGPAARDVLARLVPLDLRDTAFPVGASARTLLVHMTVTLGRLEAEAWEILAFRSMGATLVREVAEAMRHVAARAEAGV